MTEPTPDRESTAQLSLAVDRYNRYPGETATCYLRFTLPEGWEAVPGEPGLILQLTMPRTVKVESTQLPPGIPAHLPAMIEADQNLILTIPLNQYFKGGIDYDITIKTRIDSFYIDHYLITESKIIDTTEPVETQVLAAATIQVAVYGKGKYLQNLPAIYESDDFTSRFLMLFESFWKPISQQIDQVAWYFDPDLTPPDFIPWLASWVGMQVDDLLPTERVRKLLKKTMTFFQRRGTYQAVKTFLEIYTAGKVDIVEYQAKNFKLGADNTLGMGIALGTENQPNTIAFNLNLHEMELARTRYSEDMYQRKMMEIIRTMVPAHTVFHVNCVFNAQ